VAVEEGCRYVAVDRKIGKKAPDCNRRMGCCLLTAEGELLAKRKQSHRWEVPTQAMDQRDGSLLAATQTWLWKTAGVSPGWLAVNRVGEVVCVHEEGCTWYVQRVRHQVPVKHEWRWLCRSEWAGGDSLQERKEKVMPTSNCVSLFNELAARYPETAVASEEERGLLCGATHKDRNGKLAKVPESKAEGEAARSRSKPSGQL
jgi:hypothetical protein